MDKNIIASSLGGEEEGINTTRGYFVRVTIFLPSFTNSNKLRQEITLSQVHLEARIKYIRI